MLRKDRIVLGVLLGILLCLAGGYYWLLHGRGAVSLLGNQGRYEELRVVLERLPEDLSPRSEDIQAPHILLNVYEGLVRVDRFFRVIPGLAYGWGTVDEEGREWEFLLREGVLFHDGTVLTMEQVRRSLEREDGSYVLPIIEEIQYGEGRVRIRTLYPDPLFLSRLSRVFILPHQEWGPTTPPVGTGPYRVVEQGTSHIVLEEFAQYWGPSPAVKRARMEVVSHSLLRQQEFLDGVIGILLAVPVQRQFFTMVEESTVVDLVEVPSLEMIYMMFNVRDTLQRSYNVLSDPVIREALVQGVDKFRLAEVPLFAKAAGQFMATGVFGYDVNRGFTGHDPERVEELLDGRYVTVRLAVPQGFQLLGEALRTQLEPYRIRVELDVYGEERLEEFTEGVASGRFQMYLLGTKFELGDGMEFLQSVVHTPAEGYGELNGTGWSRTDLDDQIARAQRLLDPAERLEVMQYVQGEVLDNYVGLPLVEIDKVYGIRRDVGWLPRLDGYVVLEEIR